jgi:hypothetical protein
MTIAIAAGSTDLEKPNLLVENIFTSGSVTATATIPDGSFGNCLTDGTFDFWTPSTATATATVDKGSAVRCDMVGIAAHNIGSSASTLEVQSSDNGSSWITRVTVTPTDNSTIVGVFPSSLARYWRVRITNGPASIGVLKLGRRVVVPSGVSLGHLSVNHAGRVELLSNDSVNGQFLNTRVIRRSGETTLDFGMVTQDFIDNEMPEFERMYNDGRTFFYAGSPVNLPLDVGYCKRPMGASEMRPAYDGGDLMTLAFEAQVYAG